MHDTCHYNKTKFKKLLLVVVPVEVVLVGVLLVIVVVVGGGGVLLLLLLVVVVVGVLLLLLVVVVVVVGGGGGGVLLLLLLVVGGGVLLLLVVIVVVVGGGVGVLLLLVVVVVVGGGVFLGSQCKIPDHSIVLSQFLVQSQGTVTNTSTPPKPSSFRKYSFNNSNINFLNNETWWKTVLDTINALEHKILVNDEFDKLYNELIKTILNEMDKYLSHKDISKLSKKKHKHSKPFWNNQLQNSWKEMVDAEKAYRKFSGHRNTKNMLKSKFVRLQSIFDKLLRKSEGIIIIE